MSVRDGNPLERAPIRFLDTARGGRKNDRVNLRGIFPPVATPFTPDGEIDAGALRANLRAWLPARLAGFVMLGSNGEAAYVTDDEAERVVATAREIVPAGRPLVAGAGRDATRAAIAACRRAAAAGADAVLVRPPTAFRTQMTSDALAAHFTAVADASPVPVILYNFGAAFGVDLSTETIVRLAEHPNIAGLKESGGNLAQIAEQVALTPDEFPVVVGSAPTLYPSLLVGAAGAIVAVANVVPDLVVRLYDLATAGRHAEALALQRALTPLARAVTTTWGVPGLKAAMTLAGYRGGAPRSPLRPVPPEVAGELERMLAALAAAAGDTHVAAARS
jgi:4-hydroxy-2-oxoglutarate aldolase